MAIDHTSVNPVFVLNGDTFVDVQFDNLLSRWESTKKSSIVCQNVPDTTRYARIDVDGDLALSFGVQSVSGPGLISAGVYLFNRNQFDGYQVGCRFSLENDHLRQCVHQ